MTPSFHLPRRRESAAFTLIELLVVVAIMIVLGAAAAPAFSSIQSAKFTSNIEKVEGAIRLARQAALSQNTYSWVLFATSSDEKRGTRLIIATLTSKDATDPVVWGTYASSVPDDALKIESQILFLNDIALVDRAAVTVPNVPADGALVELSSGQMSVPIHIPGQGIIAFTRAIRFSAETGARLSDAAQTAVVFGLQRVSGTAVDPRNVAVVQVDSATGALQIYRP